ncbi:hypothetical protein RA307_03750 [Xanthobacteraceae bacterium Astr-EGSB]|uniref:hypothetical protein n=1 Tax=Astrobacterium formosum TaxID=3069710 RepID=UPI0027B09B22|nr:hypothetical protein [Xanthobacteraceae bacterium Astr-EGSB]
MSDHDLRQPGFAVLLLLAWGLAAVQLLVLNGGVDPGTMTDPDDVMRLVQMREFVSGRGWFDLHEPRLAPPGGYDSHWSRLIDAGLAGLFLVFRIAVTSARAEFLMGIVWPLMWLLPAAAAVAAIAWRIGGREAAIVLLLLVAIGLPVMAQFRPGRIDHHNVQITLALVALAAAAWAERIRMAAACGAFTGLALAIGLEGLPFLVVAGAAVALRFCVERASAPALRAYGLSLAVATLVGFLVTVGPAQWGRTACDMLAINWMEPVVAAGLGLVVAGGWFVSQHAAARCAAVAVALAVSATVFVAFEPRCLGGPYAMMAPGVREIWLAHVMEMQPLWKFVSGKPAIAATIVTFPLVGLVAGIALASEGAMRRNAGFLLAATAFVIAIAMTVAAVKVYNYAAWLAMPLVAGAVPRLFVRLRLTTLAARFLVALLFTPAVLSVFTVKAVELAGATPAYDDVRACFETKNYAQFARLPSGVIAGDINYGVMVLALTRHAMLAAPYHRLSENILATHEMFARPAEEARRVIDAHGVDYLVSCGGSPPADMTAQESANGLWASLASDDLPDWLEKLPREDGDAFTVYRIHRPGPVRP